ncbi:S41 family peptidase [uncultured Eubacterium sp.]|uniref:S41 family peptidase n=1 Tax=uncultured Eubacterium sp. TaxID=165185 RepID=UPI0025CC09DC|nr:S41 family peptidase [uncultured Eubacterium sp.]
MNHEEQEILAADMEHTSATEAENQPEKAGNRKKRKRSGFGKGFVTGAIVMAVICGGLFVMTSGVRGLSASSDLLDKNTRTKIQSLAQYIQSNYYEDVDTDTLQEGLYAGLFDNLDVYSQYYTADEAKQLFESNISGTYCGIGASLQQDAETKTVTVMHVYDGSPAQEGGLKEGDVIVSADDYEAASMDLTEFVNHIRGEEDTQVHLVIARSGESENLELDIARKNLVLPTVTNQMLENNTGYIQVTEFTEHTAEQFEEALQTLQNQGMTSLLVDLRSNPGGMLTSVCDMLDDILPKGLLVYTEDRSGKREDYNSTDKKSLDLPLAVLVNGYSASASEIFAGAIQDRKAGTIVGTTTYGKGVVQSILSLKDGSAFKLTTSRYFTPNGTCIQGIGITPDVELDYEFTGPEDAAYSVEYDNQIQKALEILKQQQ